jgi:glyoxylase-like metal-dependent hydrolase (beta-lactamase superfamily II)
MLVKQIWTANAYRNFNYLIACPQTGEALAIDPLDSAKCLQVAKEEGWSITQILNTHEHHDHIGGNAAVVEATGAKLIAHHKAKGKIPGVDRGVGAGDAALHDQPDEAAAHAAIATGVDEHLRTLEPFILGLSVQPRRDRVSQGAIAGVVHEIVAAAGGAQTGSNDSL